MERRAWLVTVLVLAAGCAAEFSEVKHSGSSGNLAISYCGSTGASAGFEQDRDPYSVVPAI